MINSLQALSTVEIDTTGAATAQEYLAWITLTVFIVLFVLGKVKLRYWTLDEQHRRHLRSIRPSLARAGWHKIPIKERERRGPRYQRVARALHGDLSRTRSPRQAAGLVRGGLSKRLPSLPPLAVRAGVEGVVLLVLGVLLAVSVDQWQALLYGSADRAPTDLSSIVSGLVWLIETTVPGGADALAIGASVVLVVYDAVLVEVWVLLGLVLVALSVAVVELDRRTPTDLSPKLYPDRRRLVLRTAMWIGAVWVVALVGELAVRLTGDLRVGVTLVAVAVLVVSGIVGKGLLERLCAVANLRPPWHSPTERARPPGDVIIAAEIERGEPLPYDPTTAASRLATALDETGEPWRGTGGDYTTLAYVIVRQTVGMVALVTLPIVAYFAVMAIGTGAILGPALALSGAPWYVLFAVIGAVVVSAWWLVATRPGLAPVRGWVRRRIATGTVRSAIAMRGIPVAAAVVGGLIGWAYIGIELTGSAWYGTLARWLLLMAFTGALAAGFVLLARWAWDLVGVRVLWRDESTTPPTDQVVEVLSRPLEDGDGDPIYVARVDGRPLAARDPDTCRRLVERVVDERFESGETPVLVAHEFYRAAVDRGVVDPDKVFREVRGDLDTRIDSTLRDHDGELDYEHLREELQREYPDRLVDIVLQEKRDSNDIGVRNGRAMLIDDGFRGRGT